MPELQILNNRYRLEERQAEGGMATVYRAMDLMLERIVAIKVLRKDLSSDPEFRERFRQEAKAAANLSHPNIVTVHDFGLDSDELFIVMEYVPGTDLKNILKNRRRLPIDEALSLITQACSGIGYAHRAGIIHCDIKPQNMLVTPDERLKVVDFGIARALASIPADEKSEVVWGSPQYFSPEQARGAPPSPASDVYSLGVVLFEMTTGQLPFNGATPAELARQHQEASPPSPSKLNPGISPALEQIILKVLSKEPSTRYRTADQMGRVLIMLMDQPVNLVSPPASQQAGLTPAPVEMLPIQQYPIPEDLKKQAVPYYPTASPPGHGSVSPALAHSKEPQPTVNRNPLEIDWTTWLLLMLVFVALGGLIPFWLWVYAVLNPPL
jgi:eukaryotic-like serine/threonine-protein kinase